MILITGHQRSGTGYMAMLCQAMGLDVGHERVGRDGVSSFMFAVDTPTVCFHSREQNRGRKHYKFDRIIHVVRHPLNVIASTAMTDKNQMDKALRWQSKFVPVNTDEGRIRQAIQTYIGWNALVEEQTDDRIRVEDADIELPIVLGRALCNEPPPKDYNAREHGDVNWSRLQSACSHDEFVRLWDMTKRYGYE